MSLRLVEKAEHSPQTCVRCTAYNGPFIDLGIERDFEGHAYLCETCVGSMASAAGGVAARDLPGLRDRLAAASDREAELRATLERTQAGVSVEELLA